MGYKDDKRFKAIIIFLLVIQILLLIYFIARAVHYMELGNTAGVIYNLFFVLVSIFGGSLNIYSLME